MVQSILRSLYNKQQFQQTLCPLSCSCIYLIKAPSWQFNNFCCQQILIFFLSYRRFVFGVMWAQTQDQFTIPHALAPNSRDGESRSRSRISLWVKSPFPSGCRLTALSPLHPLPLLLFAQPPLCYLEARLVACVIFWLAGLFGVGVERGVTGCIVISQSAVLYALHSDPRISWRQQ